MYVLDLIIIWSNIHGTRNCEIENSFLFQLHCQTSAIKAYTSDVTVRLLEICRQSCGGHGYLLSGGIGLLCSSALPLVTVEGENSVLYQQTARYVWVFSYTMDLFFHQEVWLGYFPWSLKICANAKEEEESERRRKSVVGFCFLNYLCITCAEKFVAAVWTLIPCFSYIKWKQESVSERVIRCFYPSSKDREWLPVSGGEF